MALYSNSLLDIRNNIDALMVSTRDDTLNTSLVNDINSVIAKLSKIIKNIENDEKIKQINERLKTCAGKLYPKSLLNLCGTLSDYYHVAECEKLCFSCHDDETKPEQSRTTKIKFNGNTIQMDYECNIEYHCGGNDEIYEIRFKNATGGKEIYCESRAREGLDNFLNEVKSSLGINKRIENKKMFAFLMTLLDEHDPDSIWAEFYEIDE